MTINSYSSEQLDQFALRFFDLASQLRGIARQARQHNLLHIPIHDRKASQWCENLEIWARKTEITFRIALHEELQGQREGAGCSSPKPSAP